MAERRMFAKTIIDSDAFLDMPVTARLLYYDLSMRADDDGFVNSPKKIMRMIGASQDDLGILILRKFILPFDSGVVVIKHWRIHNYIRKDTYNQTPYVNELKQLYVDENKAYKFRDENNPPEMPLIEGNDTRQRAVDEPSTQVNKVNKVNKVNNIYSPSNSDDAPKSNAPKQPDWASEVVDYLNEKTGKHFKASSSANVKFISARAKEGYTAEDFKKVIDTKTAEWKGTDMEQYLRPETLFSASKFEGYLNQKTIKKTSKNNFNNFEQHDYDMSELERRAKRRGL